MANLELLTLKQTEAVDPYCDTAFIKYTSDRLDNAHGQLHHNNAVLIGDALGARWGLSERERLTLRVGLRLHDVIRTPSQDATSAREDQEQSSLIAGEVLDELNSLGRLVTSLEERNSVQNAVAHHGESLWKENPILGDTFESKARAILFSADKFEQIDTTSIAIRRSLFVSGKRMEDKKEGDLKHFAFNPLDPKDKLKVFVYESVIRLTHVTPFKIFPEDLQIILKPLFVKLRAFVSAVCRAAGFETIEDIARAILAIKNENGKNLLQVRGISSPENIEEYSKLIKAQGGLTDEGLNKVTTDRIESAKEIVLYFSSNWRNRNLEEVVNNWHPTGKSAIKFKEKAISYVKGQWAKDLAKEILEAAA